MQMPKYVTLEWDEYQRLVANHEKQRAERNQAHAIHTYGDGAIVHALARKLMRLEKNDRIRLTTEDFPTMFPEDLMRINNPDGTIDVIFVPHSLPSRSGVQRFNA
jgi:hypothetical protein